MRSTCSGYVLVVPRDVASHDAVNSWRRRTDMQFVLLLLRFSFVLFMLLLLLSLMRFVLKLMWPGSRIDCVVSVLSCTRTARHWHVL